MSKDPNLKAIKKVSDNTAIREFDRFIYPASQTSIDRYCS